ncbi:MAG: hypothetical protein KC657_02405 [Myxococcales bacterium]|nr:hypothetical protein [Myxococcales bacterium]
MRALFSLLWVACSGALVWAGCSGDDSPATPQDAGVDVTQDAPPPPPPPTDAGVDAPAPRDCTKDLAPDGIPNHLECAGLYSKMSDKTVAADNRPYKPGVEFWSDGAVKQRWVYLPPNTKIDTSNMDEWVFPVGTRLFKEFKLDGKLVETRTYFKVADATWKHATYRWNADETDAVRKDEGEKLPRDGGPVYEVPNTLLCDGCHDGRKDRALGFDAVSLGLPTATGVTLATLVAEGRLTVSPGATQVSLPDDGTTKAPAALSWLNINCGPCHNANTTAGAFFTNLFFLLKPSQVLRDDGGTATVEELDSYVTSVGVASGRMIPDAGGAFFERIKKGSPDESLAAYLSGRRVPPPGDPNSVEQMPPVVTRIVDTDGHKALTDWITALP